MKHAFNVSVAELGDLNAHTLAVLGVAAVANDQAYVHGMLEKVVNLIEREPRVVLIDYQTEMV